MSQSEVACPPSQCAVLMLYKSKGSYYRKWNVRPVFKSVSWVEPIKFYTMLLISWVLAGLISQENCLEFIFDSNESGAVCLFYLFLFYSSSVIKLNYPVKFEVSSTSSPVSRSLLLTFSIYKLRLLVRNNSILKIQKKEMLGWIWIFSICWRWSVISLHPLLRS